ncbi:MAG: response regulator [Archaeoglobaceae archaeon]|nr:response regulator [Archaeoglobaceae archaeon]MDW8117557.1 response regulator [Archaeoglobaceae archaeon]
MTDSEKKVILIVDDDIALLEALELMLKGRYEVVKAINGREAVKIYKNIKPDLVLTDVVMPEMDGIEATEEILRIDPNAKIVGITAYYMSKEKDLLKAGAKEVLEKPFTRKRLIEVIEKYINS